MVDFIVDRELGCPFPELDLPLGRETIPDTNSLPLLLTTLIIIQRLIDFLPGDIKRLLLGAQLRDSSQLPRPVVTDRYPTLEGLPRDTHHLHVTGGHYPALEGLPRDTHHLHVTGGHYPTLGDPPRDMSRLSVATGHHPFPALEGLPPVKLTQAVTVVLVPNAALQTTVEIWLSMSEAAPDDASVTLEEWLGFIRRNGSMLSPTLFQ